MMIFFILMFFIQLPLLLMVRGEATKKYEITKIIVRGCQRCVVGFFVGAKAPICIQCGVTDFSTRKTQDGYDASWAKINESTGEALCTACEESVEIVE